MSTPVPRFAVTFRVAASAADIEARARAIAVEQSVEMPVEAIRDERVSRDIVGQVESIEADGPGHHRVRIALSVETTGLEPAQFLNMAFGNTSMQADVELTAIEVPEAMLKVLGGPRFGIGGIRNIVGAQDRALTCTALKPQGLPPAQLATLAATFARAGIDVIKDDHGIANQAYSPFTERVRMVHAAVEAANRATGGRSSYAPTVSGSPRVVIEQLRVAREEGVRMVLFAPMLSGLPTLHEIVREHAKLPILAHPSFAGALRIAPPLLLGKLFRLFGADATIFPNYGGRFSYTRDTCLALARCARQPMDGIAPALPVPAGGMSVERVDEMLAEFGHDTMLLIGGGLLVAGDQLEARARAFVDRVRQAAGR